MNYSFYIYRDKIKISRYRAINVIFNITLNIIIKKYNDDNRNNKAVNIR